MTNDELQAWIERRKRAERLTFYQQGETACRRYPYDFEASEDSSYAKQRAKQLCESCPVVDICLNDALRAEAGLRAADRFGVIAGMDAEERVKEARRRGCPVCGVPLPEKGKSLYCGDHATRSGRDQALSHSA